MCPHPLVIVGLLLSVSGGSATGLSHDDSMGTQRAEVVRRFGLDPRSSLGSRVKETSAAVLKMFEEAGRSKPTQHDLTEVERRKVMAAFAALPPLHWRILSERLRSVNFLDGMPNTALTSTVNPNEPYRLFDITIRAAILRQSASEWLTEKERSCFSTAGSPLSVSVEAGKRDAILFVLLHEATHIVDACLGITPTGHSVDEPAGSEIAGSFADGIWTGRIAPATAYHDPVRERVRFYAFGEPQPIGRAVSVYMSLSRTPFVSLYGSSNWSDDLAEYVAVYHWTEALKQPYRIVIRNAGTEMFHYEPMTSELVRRRVGRMARFYDRKNEDVKYGKNGKYGKYEAMIRVNLGTG